MSFFGFRSGTPASKAAGTDESLYDEYMADSTKIPTDLRGIVVAITGTTTGLGYHLARLAISKGAKCVLLLNRPSDRSEKARDELNEKYNNNGTTTIVQTVACDLMDLKSVQGAAEEINQIASHHGGLDVLCCNAGIMMMHDKRTNEGYDIQMQTNQLSHALLMHKVWPSLQMAAMSCGEARIVFQSSGMRNAPPSNLQSKFFVPSEPGTLGGDSAWFITQMLGWSEGPVTRYQQSKLANSAFVMALHHKLNNSSKDGASSKIKVMACDPGYSVTPLELKSQQHVPSFLTSIPKPKQSPADGCLNAAMCCFSPEAESGDLYAPAKGMVGSPIKVISKGQPVLAETEGLTCSAENQKIVWEGCERALGVTFDV